MTGPEFLSRARSLHPLAKRSVLVDILDFRSSEALHRAVTLGQADSWLTKPWAPREQSIYAQVGDLLEEWGEDWGRQQVVAVHVVDEWGAPRSGEFRDLLERSAIPYRIIAADSLAGHEQLRLAGCGA